MCMNKERLSMGSIYQCLGSRIFVNFHPVCGIDLLTETKIVLPELKMKLQHWNDIEKVQIYTYKGSLAIVSSRIHQSSFDWSIMPHFFKRSAAILPGLTKIPSRCLTSSGHLHGITNVTAWRQKFKTGSVKTIFFLFAEFWRAYEDTKFCEIFKHWKRDSELFEIFGLA